MTRSAGRANFQIEHRYPVRVRIAVPAEGLGRQLEIMHAWLDATCGAAGWATAPAGFSGIVNDAIAFYFDDPAFAHGFVTRFCCGYRTEAVAGAFTVCAELPPPCPGMQGHKTP